MIENRDGPQLDPTPNYDCHVSKTSNVDINSVSPQHALESTQVRKCCMTKKEIRLKILYFIFDSKIQFDITFYFIFLFLWENDLVPNVTIIGNND